MNNHVSATAAVFSRVLLQAASETLDTLQSPSPTILCKSDIKLGHFRHPSHHFNSL